MITQMYPQVPGYILFVLYEAQCYGGVIITSHHTKLSELF
jgi:hypothetical protein